MFNFIVVLFVIVVNQSLERKCIIYAERKEKMSKETAFFQWLHATEQSRTARAHFETTLVSKYIY